MQCGVGSKNPELRWTRNHRYINENEKNARDIHLHFTNNINNILYRVNYLKITTTTTILASNILTKGKTEYQCLHHWVCNPVQQTTLSKGHGREKNKWWIYCWFPDILRTLIYPFVVSYVTRGKRSRRYILLCSKSVWDSKINSI